jgi:hypothetical protein
MQKFGLTHSIQNEKDVCLRPIDESIKELISTYRHFENVPSIQEIQEFIDEMTPIIFNDFQNLDISSADIKSNFFL